MNTNELYHYGIPGMRWGHRKSKIEKISERSKKRGWSDDATEAAKIKTKKINQMSNNELMKLNNRKQLERNYKQLNPTALKKGLAVAGATVAAIGTISALSKSGRQIIRTGKIIGNKVINKVGNMKIDMSKLR